MSSILKALKKLEHEKTVQKPGALRIDADILRGDVAGQRSISSGAICAAFVIFACGVGATYFFMKHDRAPAAVQQSQVSVRAGTGEPSRGDTQSPAASTVPVDDPTLRSDESPSQTVTVYQSPVKSKDPAQSTQRLQPPQRLPQADIMPQRISPDPRPTTVSDPATAPAAAKPAILKVDGIAFQDGSADGVAVVNGVAVSKGSVIEGARVEEIMKDRVKFSRGGERFEIVLDKTN